MNFCCFLISLMEFQVYDVASACHHQAPTVSRSSSHCPPLWHFPSMLMISSPILWYALPIGCTSTITILRWCHATNGQPADVGLPFSGGSGRGVARGGDRYQAQRQPRHFPNNLRHRFVLAKQCTFHRTSNLTSVALGSMIV